MKHTKQNPEANIEPHVFDQTKGLVDLGPDPDRADPEEERNAARRLSSMNAAGVAYSNGTH